MSAANSGGFSVHGLVCYPLLKLRLLAAALLALVVVIVVWHPARVAAQALVLLPAIFPNPPFDPLTQLTSQPSQSEHQFAYAAGSVHATIFHPSGSGRHGAIILLQGAGDLPRSDAAVRFSEALARLGVVVMLPESTGLHAERLTFGEIDGLRQCVLQLAAQSDVDDERIGFVGLSAAGGLSIVAAAQPDLRERVRFVNSFGSYYDALALLLDVASRSMEIDGVERPWQPEPRTVDVVTTSLSEFDSPALRELLGGVTRARGRELIARLPAEVTQRLAEISPSTYLAGLATHLYLMHDVDDSFIPFTESRALAAHTTVERYTEFEIFAHVIPERPVPWQTFLPDLWRLYWHVHAVLLEVL